MNFAEQYMMQDYIMREQRRKKMRQENQNILSRQLFSHAAQQHIITIDRDGSVYVNDLEAALAHFGHHPELSMHNPALHNGLYNRNKEQLERGLTDAYREIR